jgi:hypothetical protein
VHGPWQIRAWLADSIRAGLRLLPPEEGWRGALVAADCVVGDHGSVTQYAAGMGRPVLLASHPDPEIRPDSLADQVARTASRLDLDRPIEPQVARIAGRSTDIDGAVSRLITSRPGEAARILRAEMYRLLELPEPARALPVSPVPLPVPVRLDVGATGGWW